MFQSFVVNFTGYDSLVNSLRILALYLVTVPDSKAMGLAIVVNATILPRGRFCDGLSGVVSGQRFGGCLPDHKAAHPNGDFSRINVSRRTTHA
jgi:hypothetical protein